MIMTSLSIKSPINPEISKGEQLSIEVLDPPEQLIQDSISHVLLQPSPSIVFPSSHSLTPKFFPSPQFSVHLSLLVIVPPEQVNPVSIIHEELQPSPLT